MFGVLMFTQWCVAVGGRFDPEYRQTQGAGKTETSLFSEGMHTIRVHMKGKTNMLTRQQ